VSDILNFSPCGHSSYWLTASKATCMACRAEKAEKRIAELEAADKLIMDIAHGVASERKEHVAKLEALLDMVPHREPFTPIDVPCEAYCIACAWERMKGGGK
jgi:Tfp pilus assembly protein PilN